jgi:hypothetical protein
MPRRLGLHSPRQPPDLSLGSLAIWVRGRAAGALGSEQVELLDVLVEVDAAHAVVQAEGAGLPVAALAEWIAQCRRLHATLRGEARLDSDDPSLHVRLAVDGRGQLALEVGLTGDARTQRHQFEFTLDQSYLPDLLERGDALLHRLAAAGEGRQPAPSGSPAAS